MDLNEVMRVTFAAREFTDEDVPDEVIYRVLDNARFAPSGGNRQGWKVIVIRNPDTKQRLGELCHPSLRIALSQIKAGEVYWQTYSPTSVDVDAVANDPDIPIMIPMFEKLGEVPAVLLLTVDLRVVASTDKDIDRIGVVSGASIYPMAWNILLGLRNEGYGGAMTTLIASAEPEVKELLGLAPYEAVCALLPVGRPPKQLTKLSRKPVEEFVVRERGDGEPFTLSPNRDGSSSASA